MFVTKQRLLITGLVVSVAITTALIASRRPVLMRVPHTENRLEWGYNFVLFNPFRDRSPELVAKAYLDAMSRGNCSEAASVSSNPQMPNDLTCEQLQREYSKYRQLFLQPLRDRKDVNGDVLLYYSRTGYEGNWVMVRSLTGQWRVVGFNKIW